ncbi:MAG: TrpB-like pyridoxal phosphate-dependent enzyme, partial [Clostridia bacterium]|nr:TrpB-like pyridoxal phosphate-dependent enzyme [Clostridia bacterium]
VPSPSNTTESGRKLLAAHPDTPGTLGMAISEAVEAALADPDTRYSLGSVLNHVVLHQTIIGQEVIKQLEMVDEQADIMIGCNGGGSNFSGFVFPMLGAQMRTGKLTTKFLAVEAAACPKLTKGVFAYDYSDSVGLTPLTQMYTLGHDFEIQGIHAGGLRYHGDSPLLSALYRAGKVSAVAVEQKAVFEAALLFAREEIILPAPESAHAIAAAVAEAKSCAQTGEAKTIVLCLSGNGYFDLAAYEQFLSGKMQDVVLTEEILQRGRATIPQQ